MCIVLFSYLKHPRYPLIVAANRDEFYARPSKLLHQWDDYPQIYAGRDLLGNGTWMGVTSSGRFAAVTNYRNPSSSREGAPSRGGVIQDFLVGAQSNDQFISELKKKAHLYNGFNLLLWDTNDLFWYSNRKEEPRVVSPGYYGLSNYLFDTPWPKVIQGKKRLCKVVESNEENLEQRLLEVLQDKKIAPDDQLPDTGVGIEWERLLSSIFIKSPSYGTVSSSVVLFEQTGTIHFFEQVYEKGQKIHDRSTIRISVRADDK